LRIVSLLPSATEIVCTLGLQDSLVGVTHECDYPPFVRGLPKVTKTLIPHDASSGEIDRLVRDRLKTQRALYTLDLPQLEQLKPDLIVTQALCDVCAVAEAEVQQAACSLPGSPQVINLEPMSLSDVFDTLRVVAAKTGITDKGEQIIAGLQGRVDRIAKRSATIQNRPRVVLLEWIDPPFSCGHWSPELIQMAGGDEQLGRPGVASRTLGWDEVTRAQPEVLFIACCGFDVQRTMNDLPILRRYPGFGDLPAVRTGRVFVVDGNAYFSRPGPRLVESLELVACAMHPDVHDAPVGIPKALQLSAEMLGVKKG
jgi:iron complex transport system substrate-binding protein